MPGPGGGVSWGGCLVPRECLVLEGGGAWWTPGTATAAGVTRPTECILVFCFIFVCKNES